MATMSTVGQWLEWVRVWMSPGDFEVRYRGNGKAEVKGQVPRAKHGAIREFFEKDLQPSGPTLVRGFRRKGRLPRLEIAGALSAGDRQRLRNFLIECLRT
ncbi:MAG TPA: hypothetical protein VFT74_02500 [Isosphaeraceae bacterium]|nr:hypothetical protein [Isosphaeraceae bacterium]